MITRGASKEAKRNENKKHSPIEEKTDVNSFFQKLFWFLGERYQKMAIRIVISCILFIWLYAIIKGGLLVILLSVFFVVYQCYSEFIAIPTRNYDQATVAQSKFFQWYLFFGACFYATGELPSFLMATYLKKYRSVHDLARYHHFATFSIFIGGLIVFVLKLKKQRNFKAQFIFLSWFLLFFSFTTIIWRMVITNCLRGYIWFHLPFSLIIINDSTAYFFGFFFGKTPLIKLSPKKTWEGFIGGAISTVIGSYIITYIIIQHQGFICPIKFDFDQVDLVTSCETPYIFQDQVYHISPFIKHIFGYVNLSVKTIILKPIYIHVTVLSLFASLIAPFGGFFASGLKRAFKMKDFGNILPGHGGLLDRFDCQFLMIAFVNVYLRTFIGILSTEKIFQYILRLERHDQVEIFERLKEILND